MKILCALFGWCVRRTPVHYDDRPGLIHHYRCQSCGEKHYRRY